MDDGTGTAKKAAVILTGFLVFVGAGCAKTPSPIMPIQHHTSQQEAGAEQESAALLPQQFEICEESSVEDSWDEMRTRLLESYDVDQLFADYVDEEMKKQEHDGWRFRKICLKKNGSEVRLVGVERFCLRKEGPENTLTSRWCVLDKRLEVPSDAIVVAPGSWHRVVYARFNTDQPGATVTRSRIIEASGERDEDGIAIPWPPSTFANDPQFTITTKVGDGAEKKEVTLTFNSADGTTTLLHE